MAKSLLTGKRVVVTENFMGYVGLTKLIMGFDMSEIIGMEGTVIGKSDDTMQVCVEFDIEREYLHDGNDRGVEGKDHKCFYFPEDVLALV